MAPPRQARRRAGRAGSDPTVWFPSTDTFAQLLRADNRAMLRMIAEHAPQSLDELVALTLLLTAEGAPQPTNTGDRT